MIALVCGGRDFTDYDRVCRVLDGLAITRIIHGDCRGADRLAQRWALERVIAETAVPAQWARYGNAAGFMRNAQMLGLKPDVVVAFPGGPGTRDMVNRARYAGVTVIEG